MLALATVGMLLIALVSVGGFTVLAQRRLRALGMLESMGATDRNVRLVLRANGVIVGAVGAAGGLRAGAGGLVGLPPAQRAERASPHPDVRPAVDRDRGGDGAGRRRDFLRRRPSRPRHHPGPGRQRPGWAPRAAAPDPPLVRSRRDRARHRVRHVLPLGRGARGQRRDLADTRVRRADRGNHPRGAVLPGPAGPDRTKVTHRHPPGPARPVAVPGPVRFGPLGHQRRRAHRGGHLRRRRRPLQQRLRLRRPEPGVEPARRLEPERPERRQRPGTQRRRRRRRRASSRRRPASTPSPPPSAPPTSSNSTIPRLGRPAEPQRLGPSVERTDLRGDAGAAAGLRHQPVVHSVQRRHPQLAPRALGLGRAADLRRRWREGRRRAGRSRLAAAAAGVLVRATRTPAHPARASPTRSSKRRASCPRAPMRRTR